MTEPLPAVPEPQAADDPGLTCEDALLALLLDMQATMAGADRGGQARGLQYVGNTVLRPETPVPASRRPAKSLFRL